jgi:alpha-galactosidase
MAIIQVGRIIALQTLHTSYFISIYNHKYPYCVYWGSKINHIDNFSQDEPDSDFNCFTNQYVAQGLLEECSSYGDMRFKETSLKIQFADGTRDFRPTCDTEISGNELIITLQDEHYDFAVKLHYLVHEDLDIIEKWREIINEERENVIIERAYSAEFGLPGVGYRSKNYNGHWGKEYQSQEDTINCGKKTYESLYGLSGQTNHPVFCIYKDANDNNGSVYFGALKYSGNFKIVVDVTSTENTNILVGITDTDFSWVLKPGEIFITPQVIAGYVDHGFTAMTHRLSNFAVKKVMPANNAGKSLDILYNSWYATEFNVKVEEQIKLAEKAAKLGVELFVVDDGWFQGRNDDKHGLGDWYVDKKKFPNGLTPLINRVNELGMRFGIWIEPEMVNPNSDLYKKHPDWVYHYKTRPILMGRNQYMLDMTNQKVIEYLITILEKLLTENHIEYVKWDMNRFLSETASDHLDISEYKSIAFMHVKGIYKLISVLRRDYPDIVFEACASGGGRTEFGAMQYFDVFWPSDNTDAIDRMFLQEQYSYFYPTRYMLTFVTNDMINSRRAPIEFIMHVAMCGVLGIGTNLNLQTDAELSVMRKMIKQYKTVRDTIQLGDLYRLQQINRNGNFMAVLYVYKEQCVLFCFLIHERYGDKKQIIKLQGLDNDSNYTYSVGKKKSIKTGEYLMRKGIILNMTGDYASEMLVLTRHDTVDEMGKSEGVFYRK